MKGRLMRAWVRRLAGVLLLAAVCAFAGAVLAGCDASSDSTGIVSTDAQSSDAGDGTSGSSGTSASETSNLIDPSQLPDSSFIYDASIIDLQNADSYMDGQTVQVVGEVVGDRILADFETDNCWITLQATDGTYAQVVVYMTLSQSRLIDVYGAYGRQGSTMQVRGTFNLACADHQGISDIHVESVARVSRGSSSMPEFDFDRFWPGILLILCGGALALLYRYLRERGR